MENETSAVDGQAENIPEIIVPKASLPAFDHLLEDVTSKKTQHERNDPSHANLLRRRLAPPAIVPTIDGLG